MYLVDNSTKLFSIRLTTGTITKKCAKYKTVEICPNSINGVQRVLLLIALKLRN